MEQRVGLSHKIWSTAIVVLFGVFRDAGYVETWQRVAVAHLRVGDRHCQASSGR